jgi:hypothetical protein
MPALAIHPDAREFLAATTDSRCRRVPLARTKRELAKAAYAEVADGLRPTPLFPALGFTPKQRDDTLRWSRLQSWAFIAAAGYTCWWAIFLLVAAVAKARGY